MIDNTVNETPEQAAELEKHFVECHRNFPLYAKTNLKIQTKTNQLIPLTLNNVQTMLEEIWLDIESAGGLIRLYILKARQFGVSTWLTGRYFWRTATTRNRRAMIVTHEPKATQELFAMQKRYLDNLHREFKPAIRYNNQGKILLNTPDGKGLDSSILVGTANVDNLGSGMTIHDLHLSESAKYPQGCMEELETSILQTIPKLATTAVVYESTANGMGGQFYKGFWACRTRYEMYLDKTNKTPKWRKTINEDADPNNRYCSIFIPAFVFLEYRMSVPAGFKRTQDEEALVRTFNAPDEYLQWRRDTLANECKGDLNKYHQEYPHTAREAFIASGTPSFDVEKVLAAREKAAKIPIVARYECLLTSGQWVSRSDGRLKVWEEPKPGKPYLISADVAEGLAHGDFDSASVWDHTTGKQVAHFHGHMDPHDFATFLFHLASRYNKAWLAPERNNHGLGVVQRLNKDFHYPRLYVETVKDPPNLPRHRYGWLTSVGTRPLILDNLKYCISNDTHGIRAVEFFDEALNFKRQDDGKEEADEGTFDDRVLDAAIGKYLLNRLIPVSVPTRDGRDDDDDRPSKRQSVSVVGFT